ncbi:MAG: hypothetical protein ABIJ33_02040, partial [Patescibacteria group bacterium]
VGIGTTSPLQKLHVAGNCVTGDTMLPIRRRRKGKKKKDGIEPDPDESLWNYTKCKISEVQSEDEVLSLNELTGALEWAKIGGLMDMGMKEVFELTTRSGRVIRTTAEHPYLIQVK